jgi:hypothetical protein
MQGRSRGTLAHHQKSCRSGAISEELFAYRLVMLSEDRLTADEGCRLLAYVV